MFNVTVFIFKYLPKHFFRWTDATKSRGDVRPEREELQKTSNCGNATLRQSDARILDNFGIRLWHARGYKTEMEGNNCLLRPTAHVFSVIKEHKFVYIFRWLCRKFWRWERKRSTRQYLYKWTRNTCSWWAKRYPNSFWSANRTPQWSAVPLWRRLSWHCSDHWIGSSSMTSECTWLTTTAYLWR